MPPGSEEAMKAAIATNNWLIIIATMFFIAITGMVIAGSLLWVKWKLNKTAAQEKAASALAAADAEAARKVAADAIEANALMVRQYAAASESRELRMGERITKLEDDNRKVMLTTIADSNKAILTINNTMLVVNTTMAELLRETRNQTGEIRKAAGDAHEALTESQIIKREAARQKPSSTDIHDS